MGFFLQEKSEAFEAFKKFKALVEKQSGRFIKALRTDRGGEFVSNEFNSFCEKHEIRRELTAPYTPEQNGVAERKNHTVVEMARGMLQEKIFQNLGRISCLNCGSIEFNSYRSCLWSIPYEAWTGRRPWVIAYVLIDNHKRSKPYEKATTCIFVDYCTKSKAYKL